MRRKSNARWLFFRSCSVAENLSLDGPFSRAEVFFSMWLLAFGVQPTLTSIQDILENLLHLQLLGVTLSSLRAHLALISAFHLPIHGRSVFSIFQYHGDKILQRKLWSPSTGVGTSFLVRSQHGLRSSHGISVQNSGIWPIPFLCQ